MSEEKVNQEVKEQEVQEEVKDTPKTYTEEEVKNLLSAKNHEKEQRKALQAELDELKAKFAKLSGDEAVEKFNLEKYNKLQSEMEELKQANLQLVQNQEDNELKDQFRTFKGLLPQAVDDVLAKAKARGFKRTEVRIFR